MEEIALAWDTLIYLLQGLSLLINFKKSLLEPYQTLHFLGVEINSKEMTLTLSQDKKDKIVSQCHILLGKSSIYIRELTLIESWELIGQLVSIAIAVMPAPVQYHAMQSQQIMESALKKDFDSLIELTVKVRSELNWWVQNLYLSKWKVLIVTPS